MTDKSHEMASQRDFINYMASGKKKQLTNDNENSLEDFVHPLKYSPNYKSHPDACLIPMNYKFQRKFYERYLSMKK